MPSASTRASLISLLICSPDCSARERSKSICTSGMWGSFEMWLSCRSVGVAWDAGAPGAVQKVEIGTEVGLLDVLPVQPWVPGAAVFGSGRAVRAPLGELVVGDLQGQGPVGDIQGDPV